MSASQLPLNNLLSLSELLNLDITHNSEQGDYDSIVNIATLMCDTPISMINVICDKRHWTMAQVGIDDDRQESTEMTLCIYSMSCDTIFEVEDTLKDARCINDKNFIHKKNIRFYAGIKLCSNDGLCVGTLCVMDTQTRKLTAKQRSALTYLAKTTEKLLESNQISRSQLRANKKNVQLSSQLSTLSSQLSQGEARFHTIINASANGLIVTNTQGHCHFTNKAWDIFFGRQKKHSIDFGWLDILSHEGRQDVLKAWKVKAPLKKYFQLTLPLTKEYPYKKIITLCLHPIHIDTHTISGYVGSIQLESENSLLSDNGLLNAIRSQYIMSITNLNGDIIEVNDSFCEISQFNRAELIGSNHRIINSGKHGPLFFTHIWKTILTGKSWRGEICNRAKDGSYYWVDSTISPLVDQQGTIDRFISIRNDITPRKNIESELVDEREYLTAIIEGTGAGTWQWNVQTGCLRVNEQWATILGFDLSELEPVTIDTLYELSHPDDHEKIDNTLKRHFNNEIDNYENEFRMRNCLGKWVWVLSRGRVLSWSNNGNPEWMFGTHLDITTRKEQDEALRKSQILLDKSVQIAGIGSWEFNLQNNTIYWSDETCRIHGVEPGYKVQFEEAISFYAPEARPIVQTAINNSIKNGGSWDLELPFIQQDGKPIWVRTVGSVEYLDKKPVRLLGALQDITERVNHRLLIEETHNRMSLATDSGEIGIWEYDITEDILVWDERMFKLYGLPSNNTQHPYHFWIKQIHPDDVEQNKKAVDAAIASKSSFDTEFRVIWSDKSIHHLRSCGRVIQDAQGQAHKLIGVNWDVSRLKALTNELSEQHELLQVTLKSIGDAVITTDAKGITQWLNPVAERMTGWTNKEAKGRPLSHVFYIINEETRERTKDSIKTCLEQEKTVGLACHTVLISRNGEEFGIEDSAAPIHNDQGKLLGVVLVFHDVTEQRRLSGEVSYQATHDALTGLINRSEFESRLRRMLLETHENNSHHVLLFIDLDQFKIVNDTCGHSVGDRLLQQVSRQFKECVRTRDILARLGGDEFGVILEHCSTKQAQRVAQNICDKMEEFCFLHDIHRFRIGTSIGLAPIDNRWPTITTLIQAADTSCYAAKNAGRNRVHTWLDTDKDMQARNSEMKWTTRIEKALEGDGFILYIQHIHNLSPDNSQIHAEVLLRMEEVGGKMTPPKAFLPAAERFHLSSKIDYWVLNHTINWLSFTSEHTSNIQMLSINLSHQSIGDRMFHRQVCKRLAQAGEAICSKLCFEITETSAVSNLSDTSLFIDQVRALGVRIALDNFGAGASSFSYLKELNIDIIKIDGRFIKDLVHDPIDNATVRCFIDVANVLGLKTVAECVDKPDLIYRVKELSIDYAQGFLLHKPEPMTYTHVNLND